MAETTITSTSLKKKKEKQYKLYISSLNTFVGHSIVESLRNDHINDENPH